MNNKQISTYENSPLVEYALKGLELCWLPEHGRWSHIYHLDNRDRPNEFVPEWRSFRAQDLGMIVVGVVAQAKIDPKKWSPIAAELFAFLVDRYHSPSGLFYDAAFGPRRRFASFATQTYLTLACYAYGELVNDTRAIEIANTCTRRLICSRVPTGSGPGSSMRHVVWLSTSTRSTRSISAEWLRHSSSAQSSMEFREARSAIVKGFNWILGQNQLAIPMLVPDLHLTIRSQVRKGELHSKNWRVLRALGNSILGREAGLIDPADLQLRRECRSYELGWILWSFGQRSDLPELTHNEMFIEKIRPSSRVHS